MKLLILTMSLSFSGCVTVTEVGYKGEIGEEIRGYETKPTDQRFSIKSGIETKLSNGILVGASYRNRVTEFQKDSMEHGVFIDVKVPIWKSVK